MLVRLVVACLGFTVVIAPLQAQGPRFDVASIKQNKSGATDGNFGGPPSRFTATNAQARAFITFAYRVQDFLIEGAPDWVKNDRWDINAKAESNFPRRQLTAPTHVARWCARCCSIVSSCRRTQKPASGRSTR